MKKEIDQIINQIKTGHVPDGYKKTKAGIIPTDWEIHPLSQHLSESRVPGSNGSVAKKLTVKLWNKGVFEKREVHYGSESTKYYKRKKGQLIYSKLDFLNCAFGIIPEELDGYESTIDLPCFDILGVNNYYLLSYITQPEFYTHYGMLADGGRKARRVDPEEMLSFPLIFPPLPEQQKIAEILSTQDKVIELKEKLLEQKQTQKKWLMQKLLSNDGAIFTLGGLRIDKSGWENKNIGDVCCIKGGKRIPKGFQLQNEDNGHPYITVSSMKNGTILLDNLQFVPIEVLEQIKNYKISKDDIYISVAGTLGEVGIVPDELDGANLTENADKLCNIRCNKSFLLNLLRSEQIQNQIDSSQTNNAQPKLAIEQIKKFSIFLPPLPEQQAIAEVLSTADKEIDLLKSDIEQEKQKKKALMQLLLTGIVRVKL